MTDAQIAALMGWSEEHMSRNDGPKSLEARVRALVDAAVAAERERCAKVCEAMISRAPTSTSYADYLVITALQDASELIRKV